MFILRDAPEEVVNVIDLASIAPTPSRVIVEPLVVFVIVESLLTVRVLLFKSIVPFCIVADSMVPLVIFPLEASFIVRVLLLRFTVPFFMVEVESIVLPLIFPLEGLFTVKV